MAGIGCPQPIPTPSTSRPDLHLGHLQEIPVNLCQFCTHRDGRLQPTERCHHATTATSVDDDGLEVEELVHADVGKLSAVAGVLDPTERKPWIRRDERIDED